MSGPASAEALRPSRLGWTKKAAAFRLFDAIPGGQLLHYLTQRYVTRTIPRDLSQHDRWPVEHARTFRRTYPGDLRTARLFEFGAGWDLHSNLVQWCYGLNDQVVVDISRLARLDLINLTIAYLRRSPPPECERIPEKVVAEPLADSLRRHYGIQYLAPADARRTGLEPGSVDLICTTSVLEHVPAAVLIEILRECRRISSARVVQSHVIDYTDHYAHSDPSIGLYNFLRFSDRDWRWFNPSIHYQNRLRHFEYGQLFEDADFKTLAATALMPGLTADPLAHLPLADRFRGMTRDQLLPRTGHWVLARR